MGEKHFSEPDTTHATEYSSYSLPSWNIELLRLPYALLLRISQITENCLQLETLHDTRSMLNPITVVSPYPQFYFSWFQLPAVTRSPKILKGKFHLTTSHHISILISDHHQKKKGECSTTKYFEREGDHIHKTFTVVCCYNCSVLLLVIIVNLFIN